VSVLNNILIEIKKLFSEMLSGIKLATGITLKHSIFYCVVPLTSDRKKKPDSV
jgi:hypothetical protein